MPQGTQGSGRTVYPSSRTRRAPEAYPDDPQAKRAVRVAVATPVATELDER